jgi:hypothetical protein
MADEDKYQRLHCNGCRRDTKHEVLKTTERVGSTEYCDWRIEVKMLECCGCQEVSLQRVSTTDSDAEPDIDVFPPRMSRWVPDWRYNLPVELNHLLIEIYCALHAESYILATLGTRVLIERVMMERIGDDRGSFEAHLDELRKLGLVTDEGRDVLAAALEAGHAAMHRGYVVKPYQLDIVMDIIETLLLSIYVLPKQSKDLKVGIPQRAPRK